MATFHSIKLEIIRPGPPHNQLLSPLTSYMALCGEGSPVTFHINLEHHQLLNRLERLRYWTPEDRKGVLVPERMREATVSEIGMDAARILNDIRTLSGEEWKAVGESGGRGNDHIHLRFVLSGSELSLIPFEMAVAPQGFPGEGLEFCLQFSMPVVPTREVRRTRPGAASWDVLEPRILLVSAAPQGLTVPLQAHVQALRKALGPWIAWRKSGSDQEQLEEVKRHLRVVPDASIESIYASCSQERFTHVHILAHGDHLEGGEKRYGLALHKHGAKGVKEVVSGKCLAKALQAEKADGSGRSHPLVVTLATCDSGNPGSVLVPGGSLAHDLHSEGIPWVFASQFPLTVPGSIRMAEDLYPRLFRGDDPRQAIYEVRRRLFMRSERDHDWASLVTYATFPNEFESQVASFFQRQTRKAIDVSLDRADKASDDNEVSAFESALQQARRYLKRWERRLPQGESPAELAERTEFFGIYGATFKRIGLFYLKKGQEDESRKALLESLTAYRKALDLMEKSKAHWVATQSLSLGAVLGQEPDSETYQLAFQLANRELASLDKATKAWACGTLAELILLGVYHTIEPEEDAVQQVKSYCQSIIALMGKDSFHVYSTRRQFQRYLEYWDQEIWRKIAEEAVKVLSSG